MALPELLRKSAEKLLDEFCREREACCLQNHSRLIYRIGSNRITLMEERWACFQLGGRQVQPAAQFRYHSDMLQWSLHYFNPSQKSWVFYLNAGPCLDLSKLLRHVEADPLHMFWP